MKIFISHSETDKTTVESIINEFPHYLSAWIDKEKLLIGDKITQALSSAINSEADFVLIFLSNNSADSKWVKKELEWALERENELNRNFLLAVVIDKVDVGGRFPELSEKKYIKLEKHDASYIKFTAGEIVQEIVSLAFRDIDRRETLPNIKAGILVKDYNQIVSQTLSVLMEIVFPRRKNNPISAQEVKKAISDEVGLSKNDTDVLFDNLLKNQFLGINYDGYELYLFEEHMLWKPDFHHDNKVKIAREASKAVRNGQNIY